MRLFGLLIAALLIGSCGPLGPVRAPAAEDAASVEAWAALDEAVGLFAAAEAAVLASAEVPEGVAAFDPQGEAAERVLYRVKADTRAQAVWDEGGEALVAALDVFADEARGRVDDAAFWPEIELDSREVGRLVRGLSYRAVASASEGDVAGAVRSIETMVSIGNGHQRRLDEIDQLMGIACHQLAVYAAVDVVSLTEVDEASWRDLDGAFDRVVGAERLRDVTDAYKVYRPDLSQTCYLAAARIALAAERYRDERGVLPDSAEALVPGYLAALPVEDVSGLPPVLDLAEGELGYRVYSVGRDGRDDGGVEGASPSDWVDPKGGPADFVLIGPDRFSRGWGLQPE